MHFEDFAERKWTRRLLAAGLVVLALVAVTNLVAMTVNNLRRAAAPNECLTAQGEP